MQHLAARPLAAAACLVLVALAGCSQTPGPNTQAQSGTPIDVVPTIPGFGELAKAQRPTFSAPIIIDTVRAGGEPVIAISPKGTILISAHPGFTHYHPSSDMTHLPTEIVQDFGGQTYLWRSTDNGTTWTPIGAPVPAGGLGPRSTEFGVSDPEFTVMADGTICHTDLEALAAASTGCSTDDGVTWLPGNPVSSGAPVDRQWLASYKDEFYFNGNYQGPAPGGFDFRVSTDKGVTWTGRGSTPCGGDIIARPTDGVLVQSCGTGVTVSEDHGATWSQVRDANASANPGLSLNEPALDAAGNVWIAYADGERTLHVAGSADLGKTWNWTLDLTPHFRFFSGNLAQLTNSTKVSNSIATNGTYVWPWISAGSHGRISVTWIGSYAEESSTTYDGAWYIFNAIILGADTDTPTVVLSQLTPEPMHVGPICQMGTTCQVSSVTGNPSGDRRLGDFFETTISKDGYLYGSWANTADRPADVISHVQFAKQTGGVRLIADEDLGKFVPTQG